MAKQEDKTKSEPEDKVTSFGIGLKKSEWKRIDEIAHSLGMTKHGVAMWALKDFLRRYDAGEIQTVTQRTLPGL